MQAQGNWNKLCNILGASLNKENQTYDHYVQG